MGRHWTKSSATSSMMLIEPSVLRMVHSGLQTIQDLEWHDGDDAVTARNDKFEWSNASNHKLPCRSGMVNSWNLLCFEGVPEVYHGWSSNRDKRRRCSRQVSQGPMSLVVNLSISNSWSRILFWNWDFLPRSTLTMCELTRSRTRLGLWFARLSNHRIYQESRGTVQQSHSGCTLVFSWNYVAELNIGWE